MQRESPCYAGEEGQTMNGAIDPYSGEKSMTITSPRFRGYLTGGSSG
jgi:hypothetical protein